MVGITNDGAVSIIQRPSGGVPNGSPVSGGVSMTNDGSVYVVNAGQAIGSALTRPSGFAFPFDTYFPYQLKRAADGTIQIPGFTEESLIPYDLINPANVYYVDINRADDTGDGTSWAVAKKGIDAMIAAASFPCIIYVRGGQTPLLYDQVNSWNSTTPGGSCRVKVVGGKAISAICWATGITISLDTGTTYTATRSNVTRVVDTLNRDAYGEYTELTYVATLTECRATPGTWTNNSLNVSVWVNRSDGIAVTTGNTRVYLSGVSNGRNPTSGNLVVEGLDFEHGNQGAFRCTGNSSGVCVFIDCGFKWAGRESSPTDGLQALNIAAVYCVRCNASNNTKDGFNYTETTVDPVGVTIDCVAYSNGRTGSTGNNGLTYHDGCKGIDIRGNYEDNAGANIAITDDETHLWCIGTVCRASRGDVIYGGTVVPCDYQAIEGSPAGDSILWLDGCASGGGSTQEFRAFLPAEIRYRFQYSEGGQRNGDGVSEY